jgi:aspartyl-tRNA(Asn)/glutamyl-tRNA(Gln) amidotransferase subunit C
MAITKQETEKLAKLARLRFSESELEKMSLEMSGILEYINQLQEVGEKSSDLDYFDQDSINLVRNDVVEVNISPDKLLRLAPEEEQGFYKVKSVLK